MSSGPSSGSSSSGARFLPGGPAPRCSYSRHSCSRDPLPGFNFCSLHVLEDRSSPFKQCSFAWKQGRRCQRPAPKADKKDGFCLEHSRQALCKRQRSGVTRPTSGVERALQDLAHYNIVEVPLPVQAQPALAPKNVKKVTTAATNSGNVTSSTTSITTTPASSNTLASTLITEVKKEEQDIKTEDFEPSKNADANDEAVPAKHARLEQGQVLDDSQPDQKTPLQLHMLKAQEERSKLYETLSVRLPSASQRALAASDPESDGEQEARLAASTVENAWRGDGDSDAESVDSDMEDPLKHACAYTAEEIVRLMRDKLIRLQKLYIEQFARLQYLLKEERRDYRINVRKEKEENFMSIHKQPKETPEEQIAYDTLKSLNHYCSPNGQEAILNSMLQEKRLRASSSGTSYVLEQPSKSSSQVKCTYNLTTNTKCGDTVVPMSKYCMKHILDDPNQMLFRACGVRTSDDGPCENPIPDLFETSTCVYHTPVLSSVAERPI